jgi:hypothetical protein
MSGWTTDDASLPNYFASLRPQDPGPSCEKKLILTFQIILAPVKGKALLGALLESSTTNSKLSLLYGLTNRTGPGALRTCGTPCPLVIARIPLAIIRRKYVSFTIFSVTNSSVHFYCCRTAHGLTSPLARLVPPFDPSALNASLPPTHLVSSRSRRTLTAQQIVYLIQPSVYRRLTAPY